MTVVTGEVKKLEGQRGACDPRLVFLVSGGRVGSGGGSGATHRRRLLTTVDVAACEGDGRHRPREMDLETVRRRDERPRRLRSDGERLTSMKTRVCLNCLHTCDLEVLDRCR